MIDKTIPHVAVLLVHKNPAEYPRYSLPEGYRFEAFRPGREADWVRIHLDAELIDNEESAKNTLWQIVSIYTIPSESYYLTHTFENDESYQKFINTMLDRSIYDFDTDVTTDDKLLTLSTCLDTNGNRIVVQAKLVLQEKKK